MPRKYRVVTVRRRKPPQHWGVQRLAGYTDGKPSYSLVRRFWSKASAVAYAALGNTGLNPEEAVEQAAAGGDREE